jgi:ribonuclease P protein component
LKIQLSKRERLSSRKQIEMLFGSGSQSMAAYPLRVVFLNKERAQGESPVQILVSVPKRHFKHAVDRNRVKRQVREAYRLNKQVVYDALEPTQQLHMAFVWLADDHHPSKEVERRVVNLMRRVAEKVKSEEGEIRSEK